MLERKSESKRKAKILTSDGVSESHDSDVLIDYPTEINVSYPTLALLTSVCISVVKFFYFGTAIAAHQYLFSARQPHSGIRYLQSSPWMKYSEALPLILASIPSIIIFDLGIPLLFLVICWRIRHSITEYSIKIYYGSLFGPYTSNCFWWEIINTLRKLAVALILKAVPANDAIQSALIVSILAGTQLLQLSMSPWRWKIENIMDGLSTLLLIGALLSTRPSHLAHTIEVSWYIFGLSILFVVFMIFIIVFQAIFGTTDYQKALQQQSSSEMNMQKVSAINERLTTDNDDGASSDASFFGFTDM